MKVEFTVHTAPRGKERPRFSRYSVYTPKNTRYYEDLVKHEYLYQCGTMCFKKPLKVEIIALFAIPSSSTKLQKNRMRENRVLPTKKPDCDNIAKAILDALNQVAYLDDKQVVDLSVIKRYTDKSSRSIVRLEEIESEATEE